MKKYFYIIYFVLALFFIFFLLSEKRKENPDHLSSNHHNSGAKSIDIKPFRTRERKKKLSERVNFNFDSLSDEEFESVILVKNEIRSMLKDLERREAILHWTGRSNDSDIYLYEIPSYLGEQLLSDEFLNSKVSGFSTTQKSAIKVLVKDLKEKFSFPESTALWMSNPDDPEKDLMVLRNQGNLDFKKAAKILTTSIDLGFSYISGDSGDISTTKKSDAESRYDRFFELVTDE